MYQWNNYYDPLKNFRHQIRPHFDDVHFWCSHNLIEMLHLINVVELLDNTLNAKIIHKRFYLSWDDVTSSDIVQETDIHCNSVWTCFVFSSNSKLFINSLWCKTFSHNCRFDAICSPPRLRFCGCLARLCANKIRVASSFSNFLIGRSSSWC